MSSRSQWNFIATALLGILLLDSCFSENAPYPTFALDATQAPAEIFYDYIIIGGGTAGCALAATLSQGANVLVLERGGLPYGNPTINNIGSFSDTLTNASPSSPSQSFTSTDGVKNARARVLGGGTCLNAGFYTRASTAYVRQVGWDQKLVNESYEWVENKLVFRPPVLEWQSAVRDGLLEVGVVPDNGFTYDHIYGTKVGGTIFDQDGHRHTAADLLEYADPTKITVYLNAVVHQIFFRTTAEQAKPKADGVAFRDANGKMHRAYLNKGCSMNEIILSAGALGSPQLLMLSGIGPKQHLMAHGIKVLVDRPMVGQGMADNPMNALFIPTLRPLEVSLIQVVGIPQSDSYYIEAASGSFFGYALAQMSANQIRHNSTALANQSFNSFLNPASHIGILLEKIAGPFSMGHLELQTRDPNDNPRVTFNYFKDPKDLQRCVEAMTTITQIIESSALSKFNSLPAETLMGLMLTLPVNMRPRHLGAVLSLEQFCIDTVMTIWHYHGGCQVGRVVDSDYKVLGVDALRVVDGSTFYGSPGTNPQATVMMLGRYMGQRILHERFPNGKK
ncbi:protein HOTHEAD-like isoform X1 [Camellia sinensis]|uniref:protein HOTHEAD-like isoform X1 n=1 Tax=Camellia sinensis TaxID=4442 RepID=UPI001035584A|nr:protein HOTHEAD-like isoform X1 [Camellia sinensis]